jgi:hypothetical protein
MLGLAETAVLGLAASRATQLIVYDSILDGPRQRLELWHASRHDSKARTFFRDLVSCLYCTGWWLSMITTAVYVLAFHGVPDSLAEWLGYSVSAWAVAAVQMLLNRLDGSFSHGGHE